MLIMSLLIACTTGTAETGEVVDTDPIGVPTTARWYAVPTVMVCDDSPIDADRVRDAVARWVDESPEVAVYAADVVDGDCAGVPGMIRFRGGPSDVYLGMSEPEGPMDPVRLSAATVSTDGSESEREILHLLGHAYGWGDDDSRASIMAHGGSGDSFEGMAPYWPLL